MPPQQQRNPDKCAAAEVNAAAAAAEADKRAAAEAKTEEYFATAVVEADKCAAAEVNAAAAKADKRAEKAGAKLEATSLMATQYIAKVNSPVLNPLRALERLAPIPTHKITNLRALKSKS